MISAKITGPAIFLSEVPIEDIPDGLMIVWDTETETLTKYSFADVHAGQMIYDLPSSQDRNIIGIYIRINERPA